MATVTVPNPLMPNEIYHGDARQLLRRIERESIALSVWSPPYYVGKEYEKNLSFEDWKNLLREVIKRHFPILKPGGFLVINIADILCFKDEKMPKINGGKHLTQKNRSEKRRHPKGCKTASELEQVQTRRTLWMQ